MSVVLKGSVRQGRLILDLDIDIGDEVVGISGANGIGKTTFLRVLAGLLPLDAGILQINGNVLDSASDNADRQIFVPAPYEMLEWFFKTTCFCRFYRHLTMSRIR